jgi:hypothetical protein
MDSETKTRSTAATAGRAGEHGGIHCSAVSCFWGDSTTTRAAGQGFWVAGVLGVGRESARTATELQALLGLSEPRVVTRQIQRERKAGAPICAISNGEVRGYYLTADPDELGRYIHSLDHRVQAIRGTQEGLQRTMLRMSGQQVLEGWTVD